MVLLMCGNARHGMVMMILVTVVAAFHSGSTLGKQQMGTLEGKVHL